LGGIQDPPALDLARLQGEPRVHLPVHHHEVAVHAVHEGVPVCVRGRLSVDDAEVLQDEDVRFELLQARDLVLDDERANHPGPVLLGRQAVIVGVIEAERPAGLG